MILVLSTASNLYWLGRYMIRVDGLCRMLPFSDDNEAISFARAMALPAWDASSLNRLLHDPTQAASIYSILQYIRENTQSVRGVISQQLFELLNILTNPKHASIGYVCNMVSECLVQIVEEDETIHLFWQLGQCIEQIDMAIRLKHSAVLAIEDLRNVVEMLSPMGWSQLEEAWEHLQQQQSLSSLYQFCDFMQELFEDGP
jgi:uncharacterized alpha-E superfamily protein